MKLIARTIIGLWFLFYGAALAQQYPGVAAGSVSVGSVVTNSLNGSGQAVPDSAANPHPVVIVGQYPSGAVAINATGTGTTDATTATLAAAVGKTTYICGFTIIANATAAATGNATISDGTWTLNFTQFTAAAASGSGTIYQTFGFQCVPASAAHTTIVVTSAAPGTGGTVSVAAWGYQL